MEDFIGFLDQLKGLPWYRDQIAHIEEIPSRPSKYGGLRQPLSPDIQQALEAGGIHGLYSHQVDAIEAVRRGENVIVSTPSASGKSLCYQVPVLEAVLEDRTSRVLYLSPTKALAQDQSRGFSGLLPPESGVRHGIFDGDTPPNERPAIRRYSQVLLTNPDMLHLGILPNHRAWHRTLRSLRYVVIDEAHVYRGVFGSHVANVIRRLRRICRRLGNEPIFILCSATLANPGEHAQRLVGLPFQVIEEDGAPYGGKDFVLWNPPMIDKSKGSRRSTSGEVAMLLVELLRRKVRTLTFVRSRRLAELLYIFTRDRLRELAPSVADRLAPYRATYLPEDRRRIERDLIEGRLLGLTTTNALELGIDIGDLDATILTGYPGSVASTWQQAGRSGRRGHRSLSILVAQDDPLDQYLMRHPEAILGKPHESARISPTNPYILKPQLLCAAYEAPLTAEDADLFDTDLSVQAEELANAGLLHGGEGRWYLQPEVAYPAQQVNIRSISSDFYTLVEQESGAILETVDEWSAFLQLHPGAIYLHMGDAYLVTDLDVESHTAYAVRSDVPYYTEVRDFTDTRIVNVYKKKAVGGATVFLGEVSVTTRVVGFIRRAHLTSEVLGEEYVSLPEQRYQTTGVWFDIPEDTLERIHSGRRDLAAGLHATEHAMIGVLPLFTMCDRNDIGGISTPLHPDTGRPQVFIHDAHPGGVGIAEKGYEIIEELWAATLEVISGCPCLSGCPSCIHSPKCGSGNQPLEKSVAVELLRGLSYVSAPSPVQRD